MPLDDFLRRGAAAHPRREALVCGEQRLTYAELDRRTQSLSDELLQLGVCQGDRVAVDFGEEALIDAVVAVLGILRAEAVFLMLNPLLKTDQRKAVLEQSGASLVLRNRSGIVSSVFRRTGPTRCAQTRTRSVGRPTTRSPSDSSREGDVCALFYTSGSTGRPKGVTMTRGNVTAAMCSILGYLDLRATDTVLNFLPLSSDYGLYNVLMPIRQGARVVLDRPFLHPRQISTALDAEEVTGLPLTPTVVAILRRFPRLRIPAPERIRWITSTGQALPPASSRWLRASFPAARVYSMYGLTECKRATYLPPEELDRRPTSVGKEIPGTNVDLVDETGASVPTGEIGELTVRGPHVMQGYWNQPEETARVLRDGTLHTGDLFTRDEEGYLYFAGRKDDLIKSGGYIVSPRAVENAVCELEGVCEAVAFGIPHDVLGHALRLIVVPSEGAAPEGTAPEGAAPDEAAIRAHCELHLEKYLVPKEIEIRDSLPKTAAGKTDIRALQTQREKFELQRKSWGKLRRVRPAAIDLARVELIRDTPPERIRDAEALAELIPRLGLNDDGLDDFPASLRPYCGQGLRIWQYPQEFAAYLSRLIELGARSYLELGTRHGGTFITTVECLARCGRFEAALGVDIMPCPSMSEYQALRPGTTFLRLNTQSEDFVRALDRYGPFDVALIDANHDEEECRHEFRILKDRCGMIALHDIANTEFPAVGKVWRAVQESGEFQCFSYISDIREPHLPMGIGLAVKTGR